MSGFALGSIAYALLLAYIPHFAKVFILKANSSYDNKDPRDLSSQTRTLSPEKAALVNRLVSCHANQFELLGPYAAGIAAGVAVGVAPAVLNTIAVLYLASRALYVAAYAAPQVLGGYVRTVTFAGCIGATVWVWLAAADAAK